MRILYSSFFGQNFVSEPHHFTEREKRRHHHSCLHYTQSIADVKVKRKNSINHGCHETSNKQDRSIALCCPPPKSGNQLFFFKHKHTYTARSLNQSRNCRKKCQKYKHTCSADYRQSLLLQGSQVLQVAHAVNSTQIIRRLRIRPRATTQYHYHCE